MNEEPYEHYTEGAEPIAEPATPKDARRTRSSEDFLVPGPTPESNAGLRQWGCTWLAFSLILMLLMLGLSFVCLTLANWTGIA